MSAQRIFAMDMDGFLFKLHEKVAVRLSLLFDREITITDCTNNSPSKGFAGVGIGASRLVKEMLAEPGFYRDLEPMEHAVWGVEKVVEMGLRPVIVSSLGDAPGCAVDKIASLQEHFKGLIHPRDYCFTSCKELVDAAYFGDDGAEYLSKWGLKHSLGVTITIQRPYTKKGDADYFAPDWLGLVERIASHNRMIDTLPGR